MAEDLDSASARYLGELLASTGSELGPKPDRMSEEFAERRIREKIETFEDERPRAGLWSVNEALKRRDVPGALRLHLVTAITHLSRVGDEDRDERKARAER